MTMNRQRLAPENRKELILSAAYELAFDGSLLDMTPSDISECTGVSTSVSTFKHYYNNISDIQAAVVILAIQREELSILGTALVAKLPAAFTAPIELQRQALAHLQSIADVD